MAAVVIRNLSEAAHKAAKQRAKQKKRSTEAELREILETELVKREPPRSAGAVFQEIREALGGGIDLEFERNREPIEPADLS